MKKKIAIIGLDWRAWCADHLSPDFEISLFDKSRASGRLSTRRAQSGEIIFTFDHGRSISLQTQLPSKIGWSHLRQTVMCVDGSREWLLFQRRPSATSHFREICFLPIYEFGWQSKVFSMGASATLSRHASGGN